MGEVPGHAFYERDFSWSEEVGAIRGRVTNAAGEPAPNVTVSAWNQPFHSSTETGADGSYSLEVTAGLAYTVNASGSWPFRSAVSGSNDVDFVLSEVGLLELRFVDEATNDPLAIGEFDHWGISWRVSGEGEFTGIREPAGLDRRLGRIELPVGQVDLCFYPDDFAPKRLIGVRIDPKPTVNEVVVALSPGVEAKIQLVGDSLLDRELLGSHLFFFLERSQLALVAESSPAGESNWILDGIRLWLAEPALSEQTLRLDETGTALLRDLLAGTYSLRAFPDDLVFEPAEVEVVGPRTEVVVRWARR